MSKIPKIGSYYKSTSGFYIKVVWVKKVAGAGYYVGYKYLDSSFFPPETLFHRSVGQFFDEFSKENISDFSLEFSI